MHNFTDSCIDLSLRETNDRVCSIFYQNFVSFQKYVFFYLNPFISIFKEKSILYVVGINQESNREKLSSVKARDWVSIIIIITITIITIIVIIRVK